jgi:hypothetical protein
MPRANIDFTDTGGTGRLKEGSYRARLESVEEREGREWPLWIWTFTSLEPDTLGRQSQYTTSLSPKAAFFIRMVLEGLGVEVPDSLVSINTDHYIGRETTIYVSQDGTFQGKDGLEYPSYKISRLFPLIDQEPASVPAPSSGPIGDERDSVHSDGDDIPF